MENINISKVTIDDLPAIQEIENESFPSPWLTEHFNAILLVPCHFIKMTKGDVVVGFAILHNGFPNCDLFKLAIGASFRSQGLGEQLLNHCIELAKAACETTLLLNARTNDERAMAFYLRMGFVAGVVIKDYYQYTEDGVDVSASSTVMSLTL